MYALQAQKMRCCGWFINSHSFPLYGSFSHLLLLTAVLQTLTTVEALLTDTLISRQLHLWPPYLKPRFNSHTNSVF